MTVPCPAPGCVNGTVTYGSEPLGWKARTARCSMCGGTGLVIAPDSDHENVDRALDDLATGDPYAVEFEPSWGLEHVCMDALAHAREQLPDTPDLTGLDYASPSEATPSAGAADDRPGALPTS